MRILIATLALFFATPAVTASHHGYDYRFEVGQAANGGTSLAMPHGSVRARDYEGGDDTGNPHDLNVDMAAGTAGKPGNLSFNYDLGKCTITYNGRKGRKQAICPRQIDYYGRVVFHGPVVFEQLVVFQQGFRKG